MRNKINTQAGELNPLLLPLVIAAIMILGLGGFGAWAYVQYTNQRDNVDQIVGTAVAKAKQEQQDADAKAFAEREKEPYRQFVGPSDLGRLEMSYPKTWSVYVKEGGQGGNFDAYLHPQQIHPLEPRRPYAAHVEIRPESYESVIRDYQHKVEEGELRSDAVTINGFNGVRLSGNFSESIPNGTMVVFKVRDKTLSVASETPEFFPDFNNIILETLRFTP